MDHSFEILIGFSNFLVVFPSSFSKHSRLFVLLVDIYCFKLSSILKKITIGILLCLEDSDSSVGCDPVEVGGDTCHHWWMSAFTVLRSVTDDANKCHSSVDHRMLAASGVSTTTWSTCTGDANVRWVEETKILIVNLNAVLIPDNTQSHKSKGIGETFWSWWAEK